MDIVCERCGARWDWSALVEDERILDPARCRRLTLVPSSRTGPDDQIRATTDDGDEFVFVAPEGLEAAAKGSVRLRWCPACQAAHDEDEVCDACRSNGPHATCWCRKAGDVG